MRLTSLFLIAAFAASTVDAASYQKTDGTIVDPIMDRRFPYGDPHSYWGPNLRPSVLLSAPDLSYTHLQFADLRYANMYGVNLTWADLWGANLSYADLSNSHLYDANLGGADLTGADLPAANLTGAFLGVRDVTKGVAYYTEVPAFEWAGGAAPWYTEGVCRNASTKPIIHRGAFQVSPLKAKR